MKRSFLALALAAVLVLAAVPADATPRETAEDQTWIVTLAPGTVAAEHAGRLVGPLVGSIQHVYQHVLNGFAFRGSERAAQALERNPNVLRVEASRGFRTTGESANNGWFRIDADDTYSSGDRGQMANGTSVRIAVLDTGIDVDHMDLAPNLDVASSISCIAEEPSIQDGQGHGTHVSGIAAAANQGDGMVGVASEASIVSAKVLDSTGYGTDAEVICGLDHVAGLYAADGIPTVVNFSLGEVHAAESGCDSSGMHQAICNLTNAGVTVVAAAGNNAANSTNSFYPAAYPETIAVSAFSALNGTPGNDGCQFFLDTFSYECDDELASFTNYGSVVDITAPGVRVQSTTFDGGWGLNSGTSMAAPFASGVAALILAADPTLSPNAVRSIMQTTGECPDGTAAGATTCDGHGEWLIPSLFSPNGAPEPDGIPEPLIDATAAVAAATSTEPDTTPPTVTMTAPADGSTVAGVVTVSADAGDDMAVAQVEFFADGKSIGVDIFGPYSIDWNSTATTDGPVSISAIATDTSDNTATDAVSITVDNAAPAVSITTPPDGASYEFGATVLADYTCTDDGPGTPTCVGDVDDGAPIDTSTEGAHTLTVTSTDDAGNETVAVHSYTIDPAVDGTPPTVILLTPKNGATYEAGIDVVAAAYTCTDDGSGIASCVGDVANGATLDTSTPGTGFTFTVTGTDNASNVTTVAHTYDVVDTTAPVITLLGDDPLVHVAGEPFIDPGAGVTDNVDAAVTISGVSTVDPNTPGAYSITYNHTDTAGNDAVTVIRDVTVVDTVRSLAVSEATTYGTVSGDFTATQDADGTAEVITEVRSGGKPSKRTSRLEHTWTVPFSGGDGTVHVVASAIGESFNFEYSFNGSTWHPMLTIAGAPGELTFELPVGQPAGDLLIRVTDADRTPQDANLSSVSVDHLSVEAQQNGSPPELVLEATNSKVAGATVVNLSWTDAGTRPFTVWKDGAVLSSGVDAWAYDDNLGKKPTGAFTYQVCDATPEVCSNEVVIEF